MAALLPAPRDEDERRTFHNLISDNLDWDLGRDPKKQAADLRAIMRQHAAIQNPKILDPFAGGGALPLEAMRLGAEAHATDLNPVAHLVELATLSYPQMFARELNQPTEWNGELRLVSEIRKWAEVIHKRVSDDIRVYY